MKGEVGQIVDANVVAKSIIPWSGNSVFLVQGSCRHSNTILRDSVLSAAVSW
jgi:hypothetical protein